MKKTKFELHPLCALFPRMSGPEFEALKSDIQANGMRHPIVTHKGMILDGGNRYQACMDLGIKPLMSEYTGDNLVNYVLSANFYRRHLSAGQQAAIVASAQDWASAQSVGKPKSGNVAGLATVADRAAQSGASERTQRMADSVAKQSPDLAVKVAHGEISLPKAAQQLAPKATKEAATPPASGPAADQPPEDDGPSAAELEANAAAERADMQAIGLLLDADDKLAAAYAEIKRLNAEVAVLKVSRNGYMNQCNDLIRRVKSLQRKLEVAKA